MRSRIYWSVFYFLTLFIAGCTKVSDETGAAISRSTTPTVFNAAHAPTVAFSVPDMMCADGCAVQVKEILSKQPGAKDVIVDYDAKTATVAIEEGKFDANAAVAALVDHRFDHAALKTDATAQPQSAAPAVQ